MMTITADFLETTRPLGSLERLFAAYTQVGAMVFCIPIALRGVISTEKLDVALSKMQRRHAALNVRICTSADGRLSFVRSKASVTAKEFTSPEYSLHSVLIHELNTPFVADVGPLLRVTSLIEDGRTILIGAFHHAVVDGRSALMIMTDLLSALTVADLPQVDGSPTLDELLGRKLANFESTPKYRPLDAGRLPLIPAIPETALHIVDFSELESAAIFSASRAHRTSVHSALAVAFGRSLLALESKNSDRSFRVMSPVDFRTIAGASDRVGLFIGTAIHLFEPSELDFWEAARALKEQMTPFISLKFAEGFLARISSMMIEDGNLDATTTRLLESGPYDSVITNVGSLAVPPSYGDLIIEKIWPPVLRTIPGEDAVGASTFQGALSLTHTGRSANILDLMRRTLLDAANL